MAGPVSNYADEIQAAIQAAMQNQAGGARYEPPTGVPPEWAQLLAQNPNQTVPTDVAHMVMGMQTARKPNQ
jgi:hypothetical protein